MEITPDDSVLYKGIQLFKTCDETFVKTKLNQVAAVALFLGTVSSACSRDSPSTLKGWKTKCPSSVNLPLVTFLPGNTPSVERWWDSVLGETSPLPRALQGLGASERGWFLKAVHGEEETQLLM